MIKNESNRTNKRRNIDSEMNTSDKVHSLRSVTINRNLNQNDNNNSNSNSNNLLLNRILHFLLDPSVVLQVAKCLHQEVQRVLCMQQ